MTEYSIPTMLIWVMENFALSTVLIKCEGEERKEQIAAKFRELFDKHWKRAEKNTVKEADVDFKYNPEYYPTINDGITALSEIRFVNEGILISFHPLDIPYCYGEYCEIAMPCQAVEDTLAELASFYRGLVYDGLIAFPWSDCHCGDTEEYTIHSRPEGDITDVVRYTWNKVNEAIDLETGGDDENDIAFEIGQEVECADIDDVLDFIDCIHEAKEAGYLSESSESYIFEAVLNSELDEDDKDSIKEKLEEIEF